MEVLDHGYVKFIESWGSDERIIESARMSTAKGFLGWGPRCNSCSLGENFEQHPASASNCVCGGEIKPGDEKLLKFLWDNAHATPFEMAGFTIEVKAPIFVFREWHRHRVPFGYNEMSARYVPLPNENYVPTIDRMMLSGGTNKQAQSTGAQLVPASAAQWRGSLEQAYAVAQGAYEEALRMGVPKELARIVLPVGRYSAMRATSNLRGWLGFLKLRCATGAQWEIRQYANAVAEIVKEKFPRTHDVARDSVGML